MGGRSHNADLDSLLVAGFTGREASVGSIAVMTLDSIADIIGEHGYALHLGYIFFQGAAFGGQRGVSGGPAFAIYEDRRIDLLEFGGDTIHRLGVMDSHKIETETVDMVFVGPVFHRVDDEVRHLLALRRGFVAASRCVAV